MDDKKLMRDVEGQRTITEVLMALLNEFPGLKDSQIIDFSFLAEEKGIAFYAMGGANVLQYTESVTGNVEMKCQYPFTVVYRDKPTTEKRKMQISKFLDDLGRWLEMQPIDTGDGKHRLCYYPELTNGRKITRIQRTTPAHMDGVNAAGVENWIIGLNLQYEQEYEKEWML